MRHQKLGYVSNNVGEFARIVRHVFDKGTPLLLFSLISRKIRSKRIGHLGRNFRGIVKLTDCRLFSVFLNETKPL